MLMNLFSPPPQSQLHAWHFWSIFKKCHFPLSWWMVEVGGGIYARQRTSLAGRIFFHQARESFGGFLNVFFYPSPLLSELFPDLRQWGSMTGKTPAKSQAKWSPLSNISYGGPYCKNRSCLSTTLRGHNAQLVFLHLACWCVASNIVRPYVCRCKLIT